MLRALLSFAADDPSKAPFYIAGVLLAVWAVVLAFLGLSRASFPGGRTGERAVIGISVVLAAATVAMAVITASTEKPEKKRVVEAGAVKPSAAAPKVAAAGGTAAPPAAAAGAPLALAADPTGNLRFDKKTLSAKPGKVTIDFTNKSQVGHDVTIAKGATKIGGTPVITNSQASLNVNLKPGQYVFYCSVPGHRQAGMQGTLTVT
jgi:plastocyanin